LSARPESRIVRRHCGIAPFGHELAKLGRPKRVWPLVVFDEAHRLRNPTSQQGQAARS
jgi:superfamily II DNA or RNA helicase